VDLSGSFTAEQSRRGVKSCKYASTGALACVETTADRTDGRAVPYHITLRGDRREASCLDDHDRTDRFAVFGEVCSRFNGRRHAYCEMTHHSDVLVGTPEANLSKGMQQSGACGGGWEMPRRRRGAATGPWLAWGPLPPG
jgi:hypothetical protein